MRRAQVGLRTLTLVGVLTASATALPPNFVDLPVADGWNQAVGLTFAPDGRMFVWEKGGRVWNVENGVRAAQPLIDIAEEVGDWRDYGLLGFAIDPNFYSNGYIYLLYVVDYHHLINFGTGNYDPFTDEYYRDTIGRLTRYTCNAGDGYRSVDYGSRTILVGESISTGFPICHQSHGIGSLVFGEDGTLLATCGDAASYESVDTGTPTSGSSNTCLSDGIITAKEDVGAYRSQLVDTLCGKVIRIDPATGDGVASNPHYDPLEPRSPRSRFWATGLRNPYRATLRPGTGDPNPAMADPGTLYIGDVGWYSWEDLHVLRRGGANLGWPLYEGFEEFGPYYFENIENLDAPNPLHGQFVPGFGTCNQPYFYFRDLTIQDTLDPTPSWPNPCDPAQEIPPSIPTFMHRRPAIDWGHGGPSRTGTYVGNNAAVVNLDDPGSPVPGSYFFGSCSVGGVWYTGTDFPAEYQNTYFHAEFSAGWIRNFVFDANDNPVEVRDFMPEFTSSIVGLGSDPVSGGLYYIAYDQAGCCMLRRISYVNNIPPVAIAQATPNYGPAPLTVQFNASSSFDPDNQPLGPLTYEWDFGDGTTSTAQNPSHVYPTEDITATGSFVAKVFSLSPPHPVGGGNWDPEVMRDGDFPPTGNMSSPRQYDTFHGGDQGNEDFIGYQFPAPRTIKGVIFQEGIHFWDGGWFDVLQVQALVGGLWTNVSGLSISPPYPGNNGTSYETFTLSFTPVAADGIRIHGEPGGFADFISVGELRVLAEPTSPPVGPASFDVTLTVRDGFGAIGTASLLVSINNTPPMIAITSPADGSLYPPTGNTTVPLTANISDVEHLANQLTCEWQTILHHDTHEHPEPVDPNCISETVLSSHGGADCGGPSTFFYEVTLKVTDAHGLSSQDVSFVYPDCDQGCTIDSNCRDNNVCTFDECIGNACVNTAIEFGDVNKVGGNQSNLDDILCSLRGFSMYSMCPNADIGGCVQSNVIDVDDLLAVLSAFGGADPCGCPTP